MARVPVSCPSCQTQFQVEPALLGRKARCKLCRTWFVLAPAQGTATLGPAPWPWLSRGTGSRTAHDGASAAGTAAPGAWKPGDVLLDLYEIREVFTGGGMGLVYRVWHRGWNLELAVKCPRPEYFRDEPDKDNFEREAETWVKLGLHPHTVACYYVRRLAGIPHVFAEYVAGGSLAEWVRTRRLYAGGPAEALARILDIAIQFAWGLHHAHEQGLVHRDVKPGNVLLTETGVAKVTDFGMARARRAAAAAAGAGRSVLVTAGGLTPAYCSPEQVRGDPVSRKTDLWSWAVSVLEMFTGAATWSAGYLAPDALQDYRTRDERDRQRPAMPAGLAELLRRCFRRDPAERPADMVEVAAALLGLYREATGRAYPREDPAAAQALADGLNNRAVSLLDLRKQAEAEALWEEALAADPQHPECTYNLGLCRYRAGRLGGDALARQLEEAAASHPHDWLPRYLLAQVQLELGNWEAARQALVGIAGAAADLEEVRAARAAADAWLSAARKPLRTYAGHADWVSSVALSDDGWFALSGGADRTLRLWDLATGECLRTFAGHTEWVTAVALAGDGRLALSGSADQTLRLWEVETGRCLRVLPAHDKWVLAVALDAAGGRGLSGGGDGLLKVWDVAAGAEVCRLAAHAGAAAAVWLAPDGRRALSGGRDGTVKLWDVAAGVCRRTFTGHTDRVLAVCGSADGRWALSGGADRSVRLWDATTGACQGAWDGHAGPVHAVCLSADGRLAVSAGGDRALRLWQVPGGRPLAVLEGHAAAIHAVCFGAGGRYAVSASADGTLALWGVPRAVRAPHLVARVLPSEAALAAWADYEQAVARAAQAEQQGDFAGAARLLRQARARPGYARRPEAMNGWGGLYVRLPRKAFAGGWEGSTLEGHLDAVTAVCVSGDGRTALSAGADRTLRRWELSTGHCLRVLEGHAGVVTSVAATRDGRLALSGSADGTLRLWDAVQGRCLAVGEGHADVVTAVALAPDGRFALSGGADGSLRLWEAGRGRCLYALAGHRDPVHAVALSPDGRFALSGSAQFLVRGGSERLFTTGQLRLWETATGRCLHTFAQGALCGPGTGCRSQGLLEGVAQLLEPPIPPARLDNPPLAPYPCVETRPEPMARCVPLSARRGGPVRRTPASGLRRAPARARPPAAGGQGRAMSFLREPDAEPIPGYRLIEPLGSGGFGEVWKCEAPGGLFKAIKFVYGNLNSLDMEGARAEQELHALDRVKEVRHPFVLSMDLIKIVEGELVIVMELADRSLHDAFLESQSAGLVGIPRDTLLCYLRDAAEALDHMNEKHNLQHLDIKPRNLFLVSDRVKVADFGLVKHLERQTGSGILGGVTPLYAPPETFAGKIAPTSDQYSLAIVYQELLTGQRPFTGKSPRQLAQQHLSEEPDLRSLPAAERPVVARALAKDPAKRFPNCLAFIRALYLAHAAPRAAAAPAAGPGGPNRPRSLADTMEDLLLEQMAGADAEGWQALPEPGPGVEAAAEASQLGVTQAQPDTGALRPTLLIGVGSLGRRALLELRCRFLDRFGELDKLPLFRFLYVDCDPDAIKAATRGGEGQRGDVAFGPHEVHHLPLQPPGHYRRRQLEQLQEWLPREKLYALPRSLKPQGSRALGRLAFTDNYLRLQARLRRDLQQITHPDAIYQAVSQTGLALRDNVPRVYVLAAASGGGSGFLVDLGFAVRRLLNAARLPEAPVTAVLLCGAPDDPATPRAELANVYATLTEINHFSDPAIPFTAQYGSDGPSIKEHGAPFDSAYLVTLADRSPEARREAIANLGSYLFHELTTPLGLRLDQVRLAARGAAALYAGPVGATPFRGLGTYSVWFPRGLLLRLAARLACGRLLDEWTYSAEANGHDPGSGVHRRYAGLPDGRPAAAEPSEVEAACAAALADPGLRPEAVAGRIEELAAAALEGTPGEALARLLSTLEEQSVQFVAQDDPGNWARQALTKVRDWLGNGLTSATAREAGEWRKSRLTRALETAIAQAAEEWSGKLMDAAGGLMDRPGRRVAAAEKALGRFLAFCQEQAAAAGERSKEHAGRVRQAQQQLQGSLDHCIRGGGFSFFGGRNRKLLRVFLDHLAAFARQCLAEDLANAQQHFFVALAGRLNERLRDLTFCRQRLRHLLECFENPHLAFDELAADGAAAFAGDGHSSPSPLPSAESFWEALRQSATTRMVLPDGETDLERAARHFLTRLTPDQWAGLDQALQDRALTPSGGLRQLCLGSNDLMRTLAAPLLEQAAQVLGEHLPVTDVAQVLLADAEREAADGACTPAESLAAQAQEYFTNAAPVVAPAAAVAARRGGGAPEQGPDLPEGQLAFLLIPASEAGKSYGEQARRAVPPLQVVRVPGQSALLFCREQGNLRMEDLQRLLAPCRRAYEEAAGAPLTSPHARGDIVDWVPLDP